MMSSEAPESLLRLEEPIRVSVKEGKEDDAKPVCESESKESKETVKHVKKQSSIKTSSGNAQLDDIVNSILPPQTFKSKDGSVWMQYTSKEPSTRLEVIKVQEELGQKLVERQARGHGICPVREDLYKQAFDEVIREVALNQPERGILLFRVRDEARMTVDAYKTLFESSIVFGIRKQLQAEEGVSDIEKEIELLEDECKEMEDEVLKLRNLVEIKEKREVESRIISEKKRKDEIAFLKYQSQNLDKFLKSVSN